MKKGIRLTVYIILIILAAVSVIQGVKNALYFSQDLQYDAALALKCGINPYEESLHPSGILDTGETAAFYQSFRDKGIPQKMEANQFPSLLMLLFPLTVFPFETAKALWLILNLLFALGSAFLLRKTFFKNTDRDIFLWLMLLTAAGTPFRNQLGVGQHTLFSLFFFMLALYLSEKSLTIPSGLALSISYFKYTLTAPLALYFLYKRRFREFFISLVPHILGTFVGARILGTSFIDMIREPLMVSSALAGEGSIDIGALSGGSSLSLLFTGVIMAGCLIAAFMLPENRDRFYFSLLVLLSLIMTYHRTYDFFVLSLAAAGTVLSGYDPVKLLKEGALSPAGKALTACYLLTLLYFFFGLRVFHENTPSLMAGAVLYYGYLLMYVIINRCGRENSSV